MELTQQDRSRLAGIVSKMETDGVPEQDIRAYVQEFKRRNTSKAKPDPAFLQAMGLQPKPTAKPAPQKGVSLVDAARILTSKPKTPEEARAKQDFITRTTAANIPAKPSLREEINNISTRINTVIDAAVPASRKPVFDAVEQVVGSVGSSADPTSAAFRAVGQEGIANRRGELLGKTVSDAGRNLPGQIITSPLSVWASAGEMVDPRADAATKFWAAIDLAGTSVGTAIVKAGLKPLASALKGAIKARNAAQVAKVLETAKQAGVDVSDVERALPQFEMPTVKLSVDPAAPKVNAVVDDPPNPDIPSPSPKISPNNAEPVVDPVDVSRGADIPADKSTARTRATVASEIEQLRATRKQAFETAAQGGLMKSNFGPLSDEDLAYALKIGKLYVEYGVRTFDEWATKVMEELGTQISKQQLREIYNQSHQGAGDPVSRLAREIDSAKPLRSRKNLVMAEERSRRAGALAGVQAKGAANAPIGKQLGTQKGEMADPFFEAVRDKFSEEEIVDFRDRIFSVLDKPYDRLNTELALEKLLDGVIPTDTELGLLQRVFGKDLISKVTAKEDTVWDLVVGLRRAGMLSGVRTAARNVIGNTLSLVTDEIAKYPAQLADAVFGYISKNGATRSLSPGGVGKGFKSSVTDGLRDAWSAIKNGEMPGDLSKYDFPRELNFQAKIGDKNIASPLNTYVNFVMRLQGAYDKPARAYAIKRSLVDQATVMAKREGLKGSDLTQRVQELVKSPPEAMQMQAVMEAEEAVFANTNRIAEGVSKFKSSNQATKVLGDAVVPFVKIPTNIVGRVVESTPAGFLFNSAKAFKLLKEGGMTPEIQRTLSLQLGRGAIGSAAMIMGYEAAKQGWMTPRFDIGSMDTDNALGRTPSSIKIGDKYYKAGDVPFGMLMAMGAAVYANDQKLNSKGKEPGVGSRTVAGAQEMLMAATEMPVVQGIKEVTDTADNLASKAPKMAASYAGSFAPAFMNDIATWIDPTIRSAKNPLDAIKARVPGLTGQVPAKVDALGKEAQRQQMWNPLFGSQSKESDPVVAEVARAKVSLRMPKRAENETEAQYMEKAKKYGEAAYNAVKAALESDQYQQLNPKQKADYLKRRISAAKSKVSAALKVEED